MKIAYIITRSDSIGGAHIHVRDLASWLIKNGHMVHVLVGGRGPFVSELERWQIPYTIIQSLIRPINPLRDLTGVWEIRRKLAMLRPNIVSTHSSKAGWLGRIAARSLRIPVIFTAHGWAFTDGVRESHRWIYARAERLVAPLSNRIITVSIYDRQLALRYGIASAKKLVTIHNGVPDVPESLRAKPALEPPRLIMVARFEEQKDHKTLLEALVQLRELPWSLELIGDGPLRADMERLATDLGIRSRIDFVGAVSDVANRLSKSQIFILTSRWEGFPRSILEAMRAGLPVLASNVGGVSESVADGVNGILVPRGDVEAVAKGLYTLLTNPGLRRRLGERSRERFEQDFTFERMAKKTIEVYHQVLKEQKAKRLLQYGQGIPT